MKRCSLAEIWIDNVTSFVKRIISMVFADFHLSRMFGENRLPAISWTPRTIEMSYNKHTCTHRVMHVNSGTFTWSGLAIAFKGTKKGECKKGSFAYLHQQFFVICMCVGDVYFPKSCVPGIFFLPANKSKKTFVYCFKTFLYIFICLCLTLIL